MERLFSKGTRVLSALAVIGLALSAQTAGAALYGDFNDGPNRVSFLNVADLNGLFGAPTVSVNSLDFTPNGFEAECSASPGCPPTPHTVSDTLTLQIQASSQDFIGRVILRESGDTTLSSFLDAYAATSVTADVFIDVLAINGTSINNLNLNTQMVFTANGNYNTDHQGTGTHLWAGFLQLDIDEMITNAGLFGHATLVQISLSNTLTAYSESGGSARIEKKDIDGLAITVVPEPGTALLMGLGLAGLAFAGDRRRMA